MQCRWGECDRAHAHPVSRAHWHRSDVARLPGHARSNNSISGGLPDFLAELTQLNSFDVHSTLLEGDLWNMIRNAGLRSLDVSNTRIGQ